MASTPTSSTEDVCPICNGAGYVRMDAPVNSPNFSRLLPCVCTVDARRERQQKHAREFNDLSSFRDLTFGTFNDTVTGTHEAFQAALEYAENPDGWLILVGEYGCGKTHLAAAIANHAREEIGMNPILAVVPDLLDYLRTAFGPNSESTYDERFNAFRGADLLILDDIGTESATPWAREKLFQIINHRYIERAPLVVTTNDLDRIEPRVRSRLSDWQLARHIFIDAGDYRDRLGRRRKGPGHGHGQSRLDRS